MVAVCVNWLQMGTGFVFPSLGRPPVCSAHFLLGRHRWCPPRNEPCPSVIVLFGSRSGLFPVRPVLPDGPWFEPVSCHHGIRRANCAHCVINPNRCLFFSCPRRLLAHSWKRCCCQRRECFLWIIGRVGGLISSSGLLPSRGGSSSASSTLAACAAANPSCFWSSVLIILDIILCGA